MMCLLKKSMFSPQSVAFIQAESSAPVLPRNNVSHNLKNAGSYFFLMFWGAHKVNSCSKQNQINPKQTKKKNHPPNLPPP